MNKNDLSERDISSKFIGPAEQRAACDGMMLGQPNAVDNERDDEYIVANCSSIVRRDMSANTPEFGSARFLTPGVVRPPVSPQIRARRIKHALEQTVATQPLAYLNILVDGRETSYFEWLGAGIYCSGGSGAAQDGRLQVLQELHYGFSERFFYLRVDAFPASLSELRDVDFRITLRGSEELRLLVAIVDGKFAGCLLDTEDLCILGPHELVEVAFDKILEVAIGRRLLRRAGQTSLMLNVALWRDSLPVDFLPRDNSLEVILGTDVFAWPTE